MKEQLIQYVNLLFAGAGDCEDIRQEILQNSLDRYDDLIAQGKVPEAAYRLAISGIGDIGEILGTPAPSPAPEAATPQKKRKHKTILQLVLCLLLVVLIWILLASVTSKSLTSSAIYEPLEEANIYQKAIANTELHVRSSPDLNASVLATVPHGETVLIGHTETVSGNDWAYILGSTNGWVSMEFLELFPQDTTGETSISDVVTVYKMPSLDAEVIASFAKGDPVTIGKTETINGESWAYISEPVTGWVLAEELDEESIISNH